MSNTPTFSFRRHVANLHFISPLVNSSLDAHFNIPFSVFLLVSYFFRYRTRFRIPFMHLTGTVTIYTERCVHERYN